MEVKLREYRARRRREELINQTKEKLQETKHKVVNLLVPKIFRDMDKKEKSEDEVLLMEQEQAPPIQAPPIQPIEYVDAEEEALEISEQEPLDKQSNESWRYFIIKWTIYTMAWITLYIFFLKVGFGAVFFAFSVLIGIYLNTSTRRKRPGEISAYSVFNRNCQSINGTLKAEELQRQMLFGLGGMSPI